VSPPSPTYTKSIQCPLPPHDTSTYFNTGSNTSYGKTCVTVSMSASTATPLPSTMKALVLEGPGEASIQTLPTPEVQPGSVIVRVLAVFTAGAVAHAIRGSDSASPTLRLSSQAATPSVASPPRGLTPPLCPLVSSSCSTPSSVAATTPTFRSCGGATTAPRPCPRS
jgi:hypothetical protein